MNEAELENATLEQIHSALFLDLIGSQAHAALCLLGQVPDPQSGNLLEPDLEAAKSWIDLLEMLRAKTEGHRNAVEDRELTSALQAVQAAFIERLEAARGGEDD